MSQETCRLKSYGPERAGRLASASRRGLGLKGARARDPGGRATSQVRIQVCVTCRAPGEALEPRAGARLAAALAAARTANDPEVAAVECFSVCKRPCTVSFSAPGAWTYIYGDFPADADPQALLAAARQYGAAPQGLIPWKERPEALKRGVVARLPPLER